MAEQKKEQGTQDINQLLRVRREKLANLVEAGNDPFVITKYNQEHHSDEVKALYTEHEEKLLAGRTEPDVEGLDDNNSESSNGGFPLGSIFAGIQRSSFS